MPRIAFYQCPDCTGTFRFMHHPVDEPPPNFCPLCGSSMIDDPATFVPTAPHIARSIGRTADAVYRAHEDASTVRAEMAAEMGGGDASDYSALRVTDMADGLRPGDVAAKMNNADNIVAKHMAEHRQGGFQDVMSGGQYAAASTQGAFPRQGESTRLNLVQGHTQRARAVEATGRMARER